MTRELFIEQFGFLPKNSSQSMITANICNYFASKTIRDIEYLFPLFVKDNYDVVNYTILCQYFDAFTFKYNKVTRSCIVAMVFLQLDANKNGIINDDNVLIQYFTSFGKNKNDVKMKIKEIKSVDKFISIKSFISLFEYIHSIILDKDAILQYVKEWSFYELFINYSKHANFITDDEVFKALTEYFFMNKLATPLRVLIRLYSTSKVHKFTNAEFHDLCTQIQFVQQKVGINIFSLNVVSFRVLDVSYNGYLTFHNFSRFMQKSGFDTKKSKIKEFIKKLDSNGDGVLQIDEFIVVTEGLSSSVVPSSFLVNLNAKNKKDMRIEKVRPTTTLQSSTIQSLKFSSKQQKKSSLVRSTIKTNEYVKLFKELTTKTSINIDKFPIVIEKIVGEKNALALSSVVNVLFNIADLNCDGVLDKNEFQIICCAMAKCLKVEEVTQTDLYKTFFYCIDGNHDGLVNVNEISFLIQQIDGESLSETEVNDLVRMYDEEFKGQLNIKEFLCYFMCLDEVKLDDPENVVEEKINKENRKIFRLIDTDNSNSIEFDEILTYVVNVIGKVSKEDEIILGAMFYTCDVNHDKSLNMEEFLKLYYLFQYYVDEDGKFDRFMISFDLFSKLDTKSCGKLDASQLKYVVTNIEWDETHDSFMKKYGSEMKSEVGVSGFTLAFSGKNIDGIIC
ncbi:EF-hand domain-containing protein [Entamoeba marina]